LWLFAGDDGVGNFPARQGAQYCGFNPSFPASSPYVVAVGATQGPEAGNPEIACSSLTGALHVILIISCFSSCCIWSHIEFIFFEYFSDLCFSCF
jgi:subtilase family serine protease